LEKMMSDPIFLKKWIDELEEKIAEKDKRIEELKKESEWKAMKQLLCADYHIITTEQLASGEVVLLKQGQIDKAWRLAVQDETLGTTGAFAILRELGIVACEECGGSGERDRSMYQPNGDPTDPTPDECPYCHGHGWEVTTGADLMASGDWVDDNE